MSQTVANRPSQLKTKEVKPQLKYEPNSATNSTKGSPGVNSALYSPYENNRSSISTEDPEDYTAQDIAELNAIGQELSHEKVHKADYEQEFAKKKEFIEKTMASNVPLAIKIKMMESAMEGLQAKINCVKEVNQVVKDKILQIEKSNIHQQIQGSTSKEATPSKSSATASKTAGTAARTSIGKTNTLQSKILSGPVKMTPVKAQPVQPVQPAQPVSSELEKQYEEVKEETKRLEETIAQLKQTRNTLTVTIEDTRDDIEDIQALLKEKKDSLDRKVFYASDLQHRISKKSVKRSSSSTGGTVGHHKKTNSAIGLFGALRSNNGSKANLDKTLDQSTSRVDTSVLQEMGSKIGNVFGRMGKVFGMKRGDTSDQILTTDFMRELDNQSTPASLNNSMVQPSQRTMNLSMSNFNFK